MTRTWLPVAPLRDLLDDYEVREREAACVWISTDEHLGTMRALAERCSVIDPCRSGRGWERMIYGLRFERRIVELGTADVVLLAVGDGTALDDLWPEWEAAAAAGKCWKQYGRWPAEMVA